MARLITQRQVENTWESGLCNCCGDREHSGEQCRFFCCALWCQCCAQGEMQQSSGLSDGCCIPCLFYSCTSTFSNLIPCIAMCNLHNSVAHASGINESTFCSCLKVCFCTACALNQVHSQLLLTGKTYKVKNNGCNLAYLMGFVGEQQLYEKTYYSANATGQPTQINQMQA